MTRSLLLTAENGTQVLSTVHLHLPAQYFLLIKMSYERNIKKKKSLLDEKYVGFHLIIIFFISTGFFCICSGKVEFLCILPLLFQSLLSRLLVSVLWGLLCLVLAQSNATPTTFPATSCSHRSTLLAAQGAAGSKQEVWNRSLPSQVKYLNCVGRQGWCSINQTWRFIHTEQRGAAAFPSKPQPSHRGAPSLTSAPHHHSQN